MVFSKFTKRPITIDAERISETIEIKTREGSLLGYRGDWLIKGIEGELYPCGDAIFRKTYEPSGDGKCRYCMHQKSQLCNDFEACIFEWKEE